MRLKLNPKYKIKNPNRIMTYMLGIMILGLIAIVGWLIGKSILWSQPYWKEVFFKIAIELNDGATEEEVVKILMERYKFDENKAKAAIFASRNLDESWFQRNV